MSYVIIDICFNSVRLSSTVVKIEIWISNPIIICGCNYLPRHKLNPTLSIRSLTNIILVKGDLVKIYLAQTLYPKSQQIRTVSYIGKHHSRQPTGTGAVAFAHITKLQRRKHKGVT